MSCSLASSTSLRLSTRRDRQLYYGRSERTRPPPAACVALPHLRQRVQAKPCKHPGNRPRQESVQLVGLLDGLAEHAALNSARAPRAASKSSRGARNLSAELPCQGRARQPTKQSPSCASKAALFGWLRRKASPTASCKPRTSGGRRRGHAAQSACSVTQPSRLVLTHTPMRPRSLTPRLLQSAEVEEGIPSKVAEAQVLAGYIMLKPQHNSHTHAQAATQTHTQLSCSASRPHVHVQALEALAKSQLPGKGLPTEPAGDPRNPGQKTWPGQNLFLPRCSRKRT